MEQYSKEATEWQQIGQEMTRSRAFVSAFEISEEQRRRMALRGERPMTLEEILAEASHNIEQF